jgi:predicted lipoprotein with Yx(FWY)xxD motif
VRRVALVSVLAVAASCAGGVAATEAMAASKPKGTKIVLRGSDFGKILFNSKKQAIYLFDREKTKKAECYGDCARAWPPVYTKAKPRAGNGIDAGLLGTTKRTDGRKQVTYRGHPLYHYAHEGPDQVFCHDVREFGGLWLAVKANGKPAPSRR